MKKLQNAKHMHEHSTSVS